MKIYRAGKVDNLRAVTIFHALARLGYEGLVILSPKETFLSAGYFDNIPEIIDIEKCKKLKIPIIRRETGGGTVLLDENQVFYQLILRRSSEYLPFRIEEAYRKFSAPVIEVYRRLGIEAEYRPVNDIVVKRNERKISGQGAGDIGKCFVFVGNILLKFNTSLMAELFRLDDEVFRKRIKELLDENMSWVERETGKMPKYEYVEKLIIEEFSKVIKFEGEEEIPEGVIEFADEIKKELTSKEVLLEDTGKRHEFIKIREGVFVRFEKLSENGKIRRIEILRKEGKEIRNVL